MVPPVPPPEIPLVDDANEKPSLLNLAESPKLIEFPVVEISTYSI